MNPKYRKFHPKWHRRRMPIFWWLGKLPYIKFITRELTSIAVMYTALLLLVQFWILSRGEQAHAAFSEWLRSTPVICLHVAVLLTLLFHTVTWLGLAPKALVVQLGGKRVPDAAIVAGHYAAWIVTSGLLAWVLVTR